MGADGEVPEGLVQQRAGRVVVAQLRVMIASRYSGSRAEAARIWVKE